MRPDQKPIRWWWVAILGATAAKLWLTRAQPIYAIGPAVHDDRLFLQLARHLVDGSWLGPYSQMTLAKGPAFPLFVAANHWLDLPLGFTQQLLYALGCLAVAFALRPWLRAGWALFLAFALLLGNPMSFEGANLTRIMRQNLATPLGLAVFAAGIALLARRREPASRQWPWAALGGLAAGLFWLTREESVWILPGVFLLLAGALAAPAEATTARLRRAVVVLAAAGIGFAAPVTAVSWQNLRHYGWFGTVEFRAPEFKAAYGALVRVEAGPRLPQVPVSRAAREAAYAASPSFARLRPFLEGPVGDHWSDKENFPAADRQMRGGWFMWALRDAVAAAGLAPDARTALGFYARVAAEVNAACDSGRLPAGPPRQGFLPPLGADDWRRLRESVWDYARYFATFDSFSSRTPESQGDYAELVLFRDLPHDRISPAPRSPLVSEPAPGPLEQWKLQRLEWLGQRLAWLLGWLVLLAHVLAPIRVVEAWARREMDEALMVAVAAWAAAAACLAVNLLVHVTSFANQTPSAVASGYPLLVLFAVATFASALPAWLDRSRWTTSPQPAGPPTASSRGILPLALGAGLVSLGFRLLEILRHGSDVPFNDQWKVEALDLIRPWLDGALSPLAFLAPHFEHVPAWTRLLAWGEVALTGSWDPFLQMTVNALLAAGFTLCLVRWFSGRIAGWTAVGITLAWLGLVCPPHAWENTAWGFQSQFPLALLFLILHVRGSFEAKPGTRGWWWAQAAGVGGLFTLASMWTAPLAVAAVAWWTQSRGSRLRWLPLATVALGLGIILAIRASAPPDHAFAQTAGSSMRFVRATLDLAGWPAGWPGAFVLLQLPLAVLALQLRGRTDATPFDRIVLALGAWSLAQALALAYARGADYSGYVSRYGELLAVGCVANLLALARLAPAARRLHPVAPVLAVLWLAAVAAGVWELSTTGHAHYFHERSAQRTETRRRALQDYFLRLDAGLLEQPATRWILYQRTEDVKQLLDRADFRSLLPPPVNPESKLGLAGRACRLAQRHWEGVAALGLGLLAVGATLRVRSADSIPDLAPQVDRVGPWLALALGGLAAFGASAWPEPFEFDPETRWTRLLQRPETVTGLQYAFVGSSPFPDHRIVGAAELSPPVFRNQFLGTHCQGPGLTCKVVSSTFRLDSPWLVIPCAGFPASAGNSLRLRLVDAGGAPTGEEVAFAGSNPAWVGFWAVDARAWQGKTAQLVLQDGRDGFEGWLAVAAPLRARSPGLAAKLDRTLAIERLADAHAALGRAAAAGLILGLAGWWLARRR